MDGADPEDINGWRVAELVPKPIPGRFRLLDAEERGWRGRRAIRLWLLGFPVRTAWLHALSDDAGRSGNLDLVSDQRLPGKVLRRRLMEMDYGET